MWLAVLRSYFNPSCTMKAIIAAAFAITQFTLLNIGLMHVTLHLPSCVTQWIARTVTPLPLYFGPNCQEFPRVLTGPWLCRSTSPSSLLLPFSSSAPLTLSLIDVPG